MSHAGAMSWPDSVRACGRSRSVPRARGRCVRSPRRSLGVLAAVAVVAAACGNAKATVSNAGNAQGVTSSQIVVGGVASLTGPIPADFAPIFDGVKAYLDMVNAEGGVDGRKIEFRYPARRRLERLPGHRSGAHPGRAGPRLRRRRRGHAELRRCELPRRQQRADLRLHRQHRLDRRAEPVRLGGLLHRLHPPGPEPAYLAEQLHANEVGILAYNVGGSEQGWRGGGLRDAALSHPGRLRGPLDPGPAGRPHDRRQPDAAPPAWTSSRAAWTSRATSCCRAPCTRTAWARSPSTG